MGREEPSNRRGEGTKIAESCLRARAQGGPVVGGVVRAHHNGPPARPHAPAAANSPAGRHGRLY
jgi:hypothetical protein